MLADEAFTIIAAADRSVEVCNELDPDSALWQEASAIVLDCEAAQHLVQTRGSLPEGRAGIFLVHADCEPWEDDDPKWQLAAQTGCEAIFFLPAESLDLVERIGHRKYRVAQKDQPEFSFLGATSEAANVADVTGLFDSAHFPTRRAHANVGLIVSVFPVVGGAGSSLTAAGCAALFASTHAGMPSQSADDPVLLIDADPATGGLDLLLGIESEAGLRWEDLRSNQGQVRVRAFAEALPQYEVNLPGKRSVTRVAVLTHARSRGTNSVTTAHASGRGELTQLNPILDSIRAEGGVAVVDLGSSQHPQANEILAQSDLVIAVVPTQIRAIAAAHRVLLPLLSPGSQAPLNSNKMVLAFRDVPYGQVAVSEAINAIGLPQSTSIVRLPHMKRIDSEIESQGVGASSIAKCMRALAPITQSIAQSSQAA